MAVWKYRIWILVQSVLYGFGLLIISGIIPEWGRWYSVSPYYSVQSNALLHGSLSLSQSPRDLQFDLAWSAGGVHQVWGLGVPFLRLPLVALAHLAGSPIFPERLALGLVLVAMSFLLHVAFVDPTLTTRKPLIDVLLTFGAVTIFLLFPPFLFLFNTRFSVYQEAVAHAYLYGVLEFVLLLGFFRTPTKTRWLTLMLIAGYGGFVRPTLVFYGFAALLVGAFHLAWSKRPAESNQKARESLGICLLGVGLFASGILGLMFTNYIRFGSATEFGHRLNVGYHNGSLYATRFDHPFMFESFLSVTRELMGSLFFTTASDKNFYDSDIIWGQDKAVRMRSMEFSTYDWSFLVIILAGLLLVLCWCASSYRKRLSPRYLLLMKMGLWCVLSLVPIFWFYLRTPALFSRYLLDFAPGFAGLMFITWSASLSFISSKWGRTGCLLVLATWLSMKVPIFVNSETASMTWEELSAERKTGTLKGTQVSLGSEITKPDSSGIPFDGSGWDLATGAAKPLVTVFVEDIQFLEVELARAPGVSESPDPHWVRAKIGLEYLEWDSTKRDGELWRIRFKGPKRSLYRNNIQPAFIALVPNTRLADDRTAWILRRVRWRDASH